MNKLSQEAKILLGIAIATVLLVTVAIFFLSKDVSPSTPAGASANLETLTKNALHTVKAENAKVTVTEFADYQCPACAGANPALNQIKKNYEGRVSFVYRHFPLAQHPHAWRAIYAAEAAGEQGKFWEMSTLLYEKQSEWSLLDNPQQYFVTLAQQLQLDTQAFSEAAISKKYDPQIQTDLTDARSLNVNSTPTIYINTRKFSSPVTVQNLQNAIEQELSK